MLMKPRLPANILLILFISPECHLCSKLFVVNEVKVFVCLLKFVKFTNYVENCSRTSSEFYDIENTPKVAYLSYQSKFVSLITLNYS